MIQISSVGELVDHLLSHVDQNDSMLWFRGQQSTDWGLCPSVIRGGYKRDNENNLTNRFRSRAGIRYARCPDYEDYARWLSLMQHYGLPTRLLDWTRSPLIALYFAVEHAIHAVQEKEEAAAIWVLEPQKLNSQEVNEDITPDIADGICKPYLEPAFNHKANEPRGVIAAMASELDMRMFVQQGCFTIHSCRLPLNIRPKNEDYLYKIEIPAKSVVELACQVSVCGFRRGDLFPDLANLANELIVSYPPSRPALPGS